MRQALSRVLPTSIYLILLRQSYEARLLTHFTEEKNSAGAYLPLVVLSKKTFGSFLAVHREVDDKRENFIVTHTVISQEGRGEWGLDEFLEGGVVYSETQHQEKPILDGMEDTGLGLTSFFPPCFVSCTFW